MLNWKTVSERLNRMTITNCTVMPHDSSTCTVCSRPTLYGTTARYHDRVLSAISLWSTAMILPTNSHSVINGYSYQHKLLTKKVITWYTKSSNQLHNRNAWCLTEWIIIITMTNCTVMPQDSIKWTVPTASYHDQLLPAIFSRFTALASMEYAIGLLGSSS